MGTKKRLGVSIKLLMYVRIHSLSYLLFTLSVDTEDPKFLLCPRVYRTPINSGECTAAVVWGTPEIIDNSGRIAGSTCTCTESGSSVRISDLTCVCKASDPSGNQAMCTCDVIARSKPTLLNYIEGKRGD